jgi:hypothetical protein
MIDGSSMQAIILTAPPLPANREGFADMTIISASTSRILLLISFKIYKTPKNTLKTITYV